MKHKMTGRQRFLTVLRGGIPDRLPWSPLVNEYFWDTLPPEWGVTDPVSCLKSIGADVAERWVLSFVGYGIPHGTEDSGMLDQQIQCQRTQTVDGFAVEFKTPMGTLTKRMSKSGDAGSTWYWAERLVKTADDLRAYQYLWESMEPRPAYDLTRERLDAIGEDGIAMLLTPATPLLTLIMYDMGLEQTYFYLTDHRDRMEQLLNTMAEKALAACRIAADSPATVGLIPENSGTLLVPPAYFARYCAPIMTEFVRLFHANDKMLLLHACGHLRDLLPQIRDTGVDGIESLTPPPTGNTELGYAWEVLGRDRTIMGGMDPVFFLQATPEEVETKVEEVVQEVAPGDHFVLMPADSTPAGVPLENFEAVRRAIDRVGKWQ